MDHGNHRSDPDAAYTRVEAMGTIDATPTLLPLGKRRDPVTQADLAVGDQRFALRATGAVADRLAALAPDTRVKVTGSLRQVTWQRADKHWQERVAIAVDELQAFRVYHRKDEP